MFLMCCFFSCVSHWLWCEWSACLTGSMMNIYIFLRTRNITTWQLSGNIFWFTNSDWQVLLTWCTIMRLQRVDFMFLWTGTTKWCQTSAATLMRSTPFWDITQRRVVNLDYHWPLCNIPEERRSPATTKFIKFLIKEAVMPYLGVSELLTVLFS